MEKRIYGLPGFFIEDGNAWNIDSFHEVMSGLEGAEYEGRVPSFESRNGKATYRYQGVIEITHEEYREPEFDRIEVKLIGDDQQQLDDVERMIIGAIQNPK